MILSDIPVMGTFLVQRPRLSWNPGVRLAKTRGGRIKVQMAHEVLPRYLRADIQVKLEQEFEE